jgi:phospholipid/cholesterol/gamma-HCH transport system ATP-binding protein
MTMENNNDKSAIRLRGVSKSFGEQKVLDRIDLEVARGETMTVLGRSGTGKSVLLKLIIGLQKPDNGEIEIDGEEITALPLGELNRVRKDVGFLFQHSALYDSLTVEENVAFPLRRHTAMADGERRDHVRELLARVGMEDAADKMPADISGGMKKRVGLARALALDPEIMLLDEPTAGLDPITASEINKLIRELQKERQMSSVVVTHDMRSVETVADRVAMLNEGSIVIEGTLKDLEQSDDPFVAKFMHESGKEN